jgi:hypothetical protein
MDTLKLGYTQNWIDYGFLDEETLGQQIIEFEKEKDKNPEHYRFATFQKWLKEKDSRSNLEINQYLELAMEDADKLMAGNAVTNLFVSPIITDNQFETLTHKLQEFGDWTEKLITREVLSRRLQNEELSNNLFNLCYDYKKDFKDNRLLIAIIQKTDNPKYLSMFTDLDIGKKIKTLAQNKLNKINNGALK